MENDVTYAQQRQLALQRVLQHVAQTNQWGITLDELSKQVGLGAWETGFLFQEYLGKEPLIVINQFFDPGLTKAIPSLFDVSHSSRNRLPINVELNNLVEDPEIVFVQRFSSYLGEVFCAVTEHELLQLTFEDAENGLERLVKSFPSATILEEENELMLQVKALVERFHTNEHSTNISVAVKGTPFQQAVWKQLLNIDFGGTMTYTDLAEKMGDPKANRAVGTAIGANPVALFIPCHRVVHASGKIGHFRWHSWRKQWLLAIEK